MMTDSSLTSEAESADWGGEPLQVWSRWPLASLEPGDIIRIKWSYEGVHGPVYNEDVYLLLSRSEKQTDKEVWECMSYFSHESGKTAKILMQRFEVHSEEFDLGPWQEIALMSRSSLEKSSED